MTICSDQGLLSNTNRISRTMTKRDNWTTRTFATVLRSVAISMLAVSVAAASALTQPKADGWVGEQANGYLGLVRDDAPVEIKALIKDVNAKRKAGYQRIATAQGTSLADVEKVGGNKAFEKTAAGNYVRDASGRWRKK